ncbi:DEAD/DEAH box helicase [Nocardia transvalensis]|uniref:DEAD/DEAH box helicase n=1 Tax=Nocardia transvalensis TaxID=37333 RepID=UPI0018935749|nr:DEAD/DEAH box helicase [Nocardia transvalensis]MBF6327943.1 DEAD/DEAH box helicase [Nocardia transvalensis]
MPDPRFADLGLPAVLVQSLRRNGLETPFPIQAAVIPDILAGRDVLGRAATGSGKTLAFGLPMLVRLTRGASAPKKPRGLVLAPTRELALQIEQALDDPALALGLRLGTAVGGVPIKRQTDRLARGVDLLIATPGRLTDLIDRDAIALDAVRVVAVDEADHMAELGFLEQVTTLLDHIPAEAQHLLFSATLDEAVDTLVRRYLREPVRHSVDTADSATPPAAVPDSGRETMLEPNDAAAQPPSPMTHYLLHIRKPHKRRTVSEIAAREGRTLLFVRTQYAADKLARQLREAGVAAVALHGGKAQNQRSRALAAFTDGTAPVLVATDVAARGIHVDAISLVVHVDPPTDPKSYLHRAGRTARAGATGTVVTLVTPDDRTDTEKLMADAGVTAITLPPNEIASVTGARPPSGAPIPDPAAPPVPETKPARPADRRRTAPRDHARNPRRRRHSA